MQNIILQKEDFSGFQLGDFPYDHEHSAMGEYHYYPPKGNRGNWYCPITDYGWTAGSPMWVIARDDSSKKVMESQVLREEGKEKFWNVLVTGDEFWQDYTLEATLRRLKTGMIAGVGVRYQNSRCMYALCFNADQVQFILLDHSCAYLGDGCYKVLAAAEYHSNCETEYHISIDCVNDTFRCSIAGKELFTVRDDTYPSGRVALVANCPTQYGNVYVSADEHSYEAFSARKKAYEKKLEGLRAEYPQPKLWKKIDFQNFGAGRSVRFGDLTGNGSKDLLVAQCRKRVMKDCYADISCLTALDLDGNVLWQRGDPDPGNACLTADLPMQIADVDGDGKNEVVLSQDFKLMILDGATGEVRKWIYTPYSTTPMDRLYSGVPYGRYAFDRVNIDCIRICNFTGKAQPADILVKDRYSRLWAYDCDLKPLWFYNDGITGHFPMTKDLNGDGREEMFAGYNLVDADGKKIWTLPVPSDHTDEIVIGKIDPDRDEELICIVCGNEGFIMADLNGNIIKKDIISHAQRLSVGNYRPELPGLEIAVTTFWFNQGIIRLYDCKGNLLFSVEPGTDGNTVAPVNWVGDGRDLIILNGNVKKGGMIDGEGNRVVVFPEDGHPDLCCEVLDITGDCRDEVIIWDEKEMWIYTQDREFKGDRIYCPEKYPEYNASNYRGEYSWPGWKMSSGNSGVASAT
jgi:rhamnogalacturonan endolyase